MSEQIPPEVGLRGKSLSEVTRKRYRYGIGVWVRWEAYKRVREFCSHPSSVERYGTQVDCASAVVKAGIEALSGQPAGQMTGQGGGAVEVACRAKKEGGIYIVRCGGKTFLFSQARLHEFVEKENVVVELEE